LKAFTDNTRHWTEKGKNTLSLLKSSIEVLVAGLFLLIACLPSTAEDAGNAGGRPLVIGYSNQIFYNVVPRDAIGLTRVWVKEADRRMNNNGQSTVVFFKDLDDAEQALKANQVDIIVLLAEEFIHLRDLVPLAPVLSADYGQHFYDELLLLVNNDGGITRLDQLHRKNLRIESGQKGSVPMQWLDFLLASKVSSESRTFFSTISTQPKASQVIMPLFFGQTDACLASRTSFETMAELNPQLGRKLRILEKSPGFVTGILAVRRDIRNPRRDAMIEALKNMHADPKGRQLLTLFRINRLVEFKTEHLASIEKVLKRSRERGESSSRRKH
jgi:phosphonate transport system substrate-binding protein